MHKKELKAFSKQAAQSVKTKTTLTDSHKVLSWAIT